MISIPMSPAEFAEVSRVNLRRLDLWLWAERIRSDPVQGPCRDDTFDPVDGLRKTYWTDPVRRFELLNRMSEFCDFLGVPIRPLVESLHGRGDVSGDW